MITQDIKIAVRSNQDRYKDKVKIREVKKYSIDLSAWAEEFGAITTATWTVRSGQASVANKTLSSNVITGDITFSQTGRSLIEIQADTGTYNKIIWLDLYVVDPDLEYVDDYEYR